MKKPSAKTPKVSAPKEIHRTTVYVPKSKMKALRQLALDSDRKVHDLMMQGIDIVLAKAKRT
jgi:hypothetical protein